MTVAELIKKLKQYDSKKEVRIAQPTHNHWRQVEAAEISEVEMQGLLWSDYLNGDKLLDGDEEDDADKYAVVIS